MAVAKREEIPDYLLADPIAPELIWETGSLGSPVLALRGGYPDVLERMADHYAERFRKGWRDLAGGLAVFMAPSTAHALTARDAQGLVLSLCAARGIAVFDLRDATIRGSGDGRRRRGDPDESLYIGEQAERCRAMVRAGRGNDDIGEAMDDTPADLAVEVEHTHYERAKRAIYRGAGVGELWEIATGSAGRAPAIVDLQAPGGPRPVETSAVVPGVRADGLDEALRMLREIGGIVEFVRADERGEPVAERLLAAAGATEAEGPAPR